jgi:hypothetical protein
MHLHKLLFIIFFHTSLAVLQFPYPEQTLELPNHPSNWMCTVHITVASFANYTTSDITERFLVSNREKIIPTVSVVTNRSIGIPPVNSFFEPCTINVLMDATVHGSSYLFKGQRLHNYFSGNEYVNRGWRHSLIILIFFSCYFEINPISNRLPHRLFYHSLDCGDENIFPNLAFAPDPVQSLWEINDSKHSIHHRTLPLLLRRSISTPKYAWDRHFPNVKPGLCLASRWDHLSQMLYCKRDRIAVHHYQHFINFTAVANTDNNAPDNGKVFTNVKYWGFRPSKSLHAIDSSNERILYCDRNSDSPRLRPLSLSSPFSFKTWVTLVFLLIFCAIAPSFTMLGTRPVAKDWTTIIFIKTILNSLFELIIGLFENDVGENNFTKPFIGLLVIYLGNNYKNYLTIELVFPRAGDAISTLTELLDLNFNVITRVTNESIGDDRLAWLKRMNYHLEIDETKREKYVSETESWFKPIHSEEDIIKELASVTSKNAWILSAPYFIQLDYLNKITRYNYPLSCHFVKRPFAHQFLEFYFYNPKSEEFKWWTAKFLDHGLFEFWKHLHSHTLTLTERKFSLEGRPERTNSSSVEAFDFQNFIGQVHLIVFYILISIITAICVAIFLLEWAMQNARALSLIILNKFKHISLKSPWAIVCSLSLNSRPKGARIDKIAANIHKIEVKPQQQ